MPGPVDEKQRDRVGFADTPLVDYLKHVARGVGARTSAAGATRARFGVASQLASPLTGAGSTLDRCNVSPTRANVADPGSEERSDVVSVLLPGPDENAEPIRIGTSPSSC